MSAVYNLYYCELSTVEVRNTSHFRNIREIKIVFAGMFDSIWNFNAHHWIEKGLFKRCICIFLRNMSYERK